MSSGNARVALLRARRRLRAELSKVVGFADLAIQGLAFASPVLGSGVNRALVSITHMSSGSYEVTYDHRTLYLYDEERVRLSPNDHVESGGSAGNGDGVRGPDGVMSVIPQPT